MMAEKIAPSKPCTKCGTDKPLAAFANPGRTRCGACDYIVWKQKPVNIESRRILLERRAEMRAGKADRDREYGLKYRAANASRLKSARADYYAANSARIYAAKVAYRAANAEKVKDGNAKWRAANRDKTRASNTAWADANKDKRSAGYAAYRAANGDAIRSRARSAGIAAKLNKAKKYSALVAGWQKRNPGKSRIEFEKRRDKRLRAKKEWPE